MDVLTKQFARLARRSGLTDDDLRRSLKEANNGLIEADLGYRLIKQRVARKGKGKSGGFRVIIYHRVRQRSVFLHVFAKSEKGNLSPAELDAYRDFAKVRDQLDDNRIEALIERRGWRRLENGESEEDISK